MKRFLVGYHYIFIPQAGGSDGIPEVTGFSDEIQMLILSTDNTVMAVGAFTGVFGSGYNRIVNLKTGFSINASFNPGQGFPNGIVSAILQSGNVYYVGGSFTGYDGQARERLVKITTGGAIDNNFIYPVVGVNNNSTAVYDIKLDNSGNVLIGGFFTGVSGIGTTGLARFTGSGLLDIDFKLNLSGWGGSTWINSLFVDSNHKIIIGGRFSGIDGIERINVARINSNGALDTSFDAKQIEKTTNEIYSVKEHIDSKILIGGQFTGITGLSRTSILRLKTGGTVDETFNTSISGSDGTRWIYDINIQQNDEVLIGGEFTGVDSFKISGIARLSLNGAMDTLFNSGSGTTNDGSSTSAGGVFTWLRIPDISQIWFGGNFDKFNQVTANNIARLSGQIISSAVGGGKNIGGSSFAINTDAFPTPNPIGIGYVRGTNELYVANDSVTGVGIIDPDARTVENIGIGGVAGRKQVLYVSGIDQVYLSEPSNNTIIRVNPYTRANAGGVGTLNSPQGMAYSMHTGHNKVYVASTNSGIYLIDVATSTIDTRISIGDNLNFEQIEYCPDNGRIYATKADTAGTVKVLNTSDNSIIASIDVGAEPVGIVYASGDTKDNRIYVCNRASDTVSVIDTGTNTVIETINVGDGPQSIDYHTGRKHIIVANRFDGSLSLIDGRFNQVIQTLDFNTAQLTDIVFWPSGDKYYATDRTNNIVYVIGYV